MKTLYFMRHGESEFNKANKWLGASTDSPLTKKGVKQAQKAGGQIKKTGVTFDIVISSPLKRAIQTAEEVVKIIGYPSEKIHINEAVIERDFGSLEGKKQLVAATQYLFDESSIDRHEGVENLMDFQERVNEFLKYLYTLPEDNILLVGHGAFGRALRRAVNKESLTARGKVFHNAEFERLI